MLAQGADVLYLSIPSYRTRITHYVNSRKSKTCFFHSLVFLALCYFSRYTEKDCLINCVLHYNSASSIEFKKTLNISVVVVFGNRSNEKVNNAMYLQCEMVINFISFPTFIKFYS